MSYLQISVNLYDLHCRRVKISHQLLNSDYALDTTSTCAFWMRCCFVFFLSFFIFIFCQCGYTEGTLNHFQVHGPLLLFSMVKIAAATSI